ncbi:MAG: WXG100 family type VII secretion target [Chloroflexi bacterium]|nr:WXG100 family type VII secretion target [Chloroflexota bacterium]
MDKVQYRYEDLERISHQFGEMHSQINDGVFKFIRQYEVLEGGGWVGRGFDKFSDEVRSELMPAMRKLSDVLEQLAGITRQAGERMQQAEEEARGRFNF